MKISSRKRVCARGFTLIEILVVVAILALLIAILLPSLRNAKELSKATVCGTRMNDVFKGTLMYAHANKDRLPYYGWLDGRVNTDMSQWWPTQIARYVGNQFEEYRCPADAKPYTVDVVYRKGTIRMKMNGEVGVPLKLTWRSSCDLLEEIRPSVYIARKMTYFRRPANALLMVEASSKVDTPDRECFRFADDMKKADNPTSIRLNPQILTWRRHLGKSNLIFMDGHVSRLTPKQVVRLADQMIGFLQ